MPPRQWGLFCCVIYVKSASKLRQMRQVGVEEAALCDATLLFGRKVVCLGPYIFPI